MKYLNSIAIVALLFAAISDKQTRASFVRLIETTTPSAIDSEGAVYTKSDNKLYFQDGAGVEHELLVTSPSRSQMIDEDNTDVFVINDQTTKHAYHTDGLSSSLLNGWTFDIGGGGTSVAISSVADGGGGEIAVTTGAAHGLAVGNVISQTNMSVTAYDGIFVVNTVTSSTIYEVTAVIGATATGTMDEASRLVASVGSAGDYKIEWHASAMGASADETFDWELQLNATAIPGTKVRRLFGPAGDYGSMGNGVDVTIADSDVVTLAFGNNTSSANVTVRNLTIVLNKL